MVEENEKVKKKILRTSLRNFIFAVFGGMHDVIKIPIIGIRYQKVFKFCYTPFKFHTDVSRPVHNLVRKYI